jgi:hypothetical protein
MEHRERRPIGIGMLDGFGPVPSDQSEMPTLKAAAEELPATDRNHRSRREPAVRMAAHGPRLDPSAWDRRAGSEQLIRLPRF